MSEKKKKRSKNADEVMMFFNSLPVPEASVKWTFILSDCQLSTSPDPDYKDT